MVEGTVLLSGRSPISKVKGIALRPAMAPKKFASVRYKARPVTLTPFRDDTGLIAFRYEQTVQAEPPILIPPRNPLRCSARPFSAFASPVVVAPPMAPPTEQHPAFRSSLAERASSLDDWKRDSILASTSSSATIHEDESEDDALYNKLLELAEKTAVSPAVEPIPEPVDVAASVHSADEPSTEPSAGCTPPPASPESSVGDADLPRPSTLPRKLSKSFSFRSGMPSKKLQKKNLSEVPDVPALTAAMHTLAAAGSPKSLPPNEMPSASPRPRTATRDTDLPFDHDFEPLSIAIPTDSLLDDDFYSSVTFSKRGSIMFGGRRTLFADGIMESKPRTTETAVTPPSTEYRSDDAVASSTADAAPRGLLPTPNICVTSADVERESQKVRSLYEFGENINWEEGGRAPSFVGERLEPTPEAPAEENEDDAPSEHLSAALGTPRSASSLSFRHYSPAHRQFELAGGIEDWEDVEGADVDRYGFISNRKPESREGTPTELKSGASPSTRRNILTRRDPSGNLSPSARGRTPSRKVSARSLNTHTSELSTVSRRSTRSAIRQAGNLLPHNRGRRWMDEAGDMLTLAPGLSDIVEDPHAEKISQALKRKEWERFEKWRKMAKVIKKGEDGEGMEFEFDVKNQKLIDRTWKGIPDRWRAAAWYSFLATSARSKKGSATEEQIIADFHRLQETSSPDDIQIDLDVPRTISRHIMFRRRYRGGQRLLFRVLHSLSLYFPETGYVQGMASLAATLLCYFDEEKCFVMLVRMWVLRGLERLYRPGLEGLMKALKDFENHWLAGKDVAKKLTELNIDATAYGTRWYLTLFNLSIPFPAQLRVWDVFMLLGETTSESTEAESQATAASQTTGLDILHAASAALIHALREVLLDSDFENAMKALTSWIPVKDEELLMKVTRAEWKLHQGKKKP